MALKPVTVSQLNDYISRVLTTDPLLGNITVKGEISNYKLHSSGHVYFSLVDENAKINCFFASSYVSRLSYALDNGLEITASGYINVYKKGGTYTLFIRSVSVSGEGNLAQAFQLMKDKLEKEGLFNPKYKKAIPAFPKKVGVVTSETGAAVRDIIKIITSRNNLTDITVFPVQVQGTGAAEDIARMIDYVNANCFDIDTLIVGRGGGSQEELWAFNEEVVARAIFASRIPVISAVGHETDFSISDFVADRRAETPTAAAEMAVPDIKELKEKVGDLKLRLVSNLTGRIRLHEMLTSNLLRSMQEALIRKSDKYSAEMEKCRLYLEENNPLNILGKGYSVLLDAEGGIVRDPETINEDDMFTLRLKNGSVKFRFKDAEVEKN